MASPTPSLSRSWGRVGGRSSPPPPGGCGGSASSQAQGLFCLLPPLSTWVVTPGHGPRILVAPCRADRGPVDVAECEPQKSRTGTAGALLPCVAPLHGSLCNTLRGPACRSAPSRPPSTQKPGLRHPVSLTFSRERRPCNQGASATEQVPRPTPAHPFHRGVPGGLVWRMGGRWVGVGPCKENNMDLSAPRDWT